MLGFMVAGMMTVLAMLLMMARTDMLKWLGYANVVDILATFVMIYLFHDTFAGVVSASFAGVFMSGMLWMLRKTLGYKKLQIVRAGWMVRLAWVQYPPVWKMES